MTPTSTSTSALPRLDRQRRLTGRQGWAVAAQLAMLGYLTIDNQVDLFPWNNLETTGRQNLGTLWGAIRGLATAAAVVAGGPRVRTAAAVWSWTWLGLQVLQWWPPYLLDRHPLTLDGGRWYHDGGYAETLHLLPSEPGRVVPDLQHHTLQLLSLLAAITVTRAARRRP